MLRKATPRKTRACFPRRCDPFTWEHLISSSLTNGWQRHWKYLLAPI